MSSSDDEEKLKLYAAALHVIANMASSYFDQSAQLAKISTIAHRALKGTLRLEPFDRLEIQKTQTPEIAKTSS